MRLLLLLFSIFICSMMLTSCSNNKEVKFKSQDRFNAEEFFEQEIETLSKRNQGLIKTIINDGKIEEKVVENVDWKLELKPFSEININKPAQINSYIIDSIGKGDTLKIIYSANEPSTHLQRLEINYNHGKPSVITAISKASNMYYNSVDTIVYYGNGSYRISAYSKPKMGKEISFELKAKSK